MQKLFNEVASLDQRCYEKFALTEDILMENAGGGIARYIYNNFPLGSKVIVVCGSGNNGADGAVCARVLHKDYDVKILYIKPPKSKMALLQEKRVKALNIKFCDTITKCDVIIDSIVGTGFNGKFNTKIQTIIDDINNLKAFKIACDVPSLGFNADITLTMGALKKGMFLDNLKDSMGQIKVLNLGISRDIYEGDTNWYLLDLDDLKLPYRDKKDSHKGNYGHLAVVCGQKSGASILSASSALRFGAGLVTLVGFEDINIPDSIMYSHQLPLNTTAIALGMGLGYEFSDNELSKFISKDIPMVCDADIFNMEIILKILDKKNLILTPHPKEFISLLKITNLANITVSQLQENRFKYVEIFCDKYPDVTLLLKGANVIIGKKNRFFINPYGNSTLSKGGSGDVLSGLIGALLAQNYSCLESAINASLAHTKLALNYKGANFSLIPEDLIKGIKSL